MKKQATAKSNLKLKLNRETLRRLNDKDALLAIGASLDPCRSTHASPNTSPVRVSCP
jgi:hypothetical protein